jgi:type IV secretion system protein VirB8
MKSDVPPSADRGAYYAQAQSWAEDIHEALRASRRRAFYVAGAATAVAALEAIALAGLAPLKTVVPYTITVDRQTGYIETAQALKPGALSQNTAVTQAFLAQYVLARETFDVTDLQNNYREVAAWTGGAARDQYIRAMQTSNPQAPENLNSADSVVKITVKSISLLSPGSALVRFDAALINGGGTPASRQPYTAVIGFRYTGAPMRTEDRFLNPLGFQVTAYRKDAETAESVPAAQVSP